MDCFGNKYTISKDSVSKFSIFFVRNFLRNSLIGIFKNSYRKSYKIFSDIPPQIFLKNYLGIPLKSLLHGFMDSNSFFFLKNYFKDLFEIFFAGIASGILPRIALEFYPRILIKFLQNSQQNFFGNCFFGHFSGQIFSRKSTKKYLKNSS